MCAEHEPAYAERVGSLRHVERRGVSADAAGGTDRSDHPAASAKRKSAPATQPGSRQNWGSDHAAPKQ
jgi:hypothetical protein